MMSIQSTWKNLTEKKTTVASTTVNEHKTDKETLGITAKKRSFIESSQSTSHSENGIVSELIYSEHQSVINHILLPLLRQSGKEERWLLWVNPNKRLSRQWLINAGLPLDKIVQLNQIRPTASIAAMEKALASGNYSIILGWLPELSAYQLNRLQMAAQRGTTLGFIMRPQNRLRRLISPPNKLHIYSNYYH